MSKGVKNVDNMTDEEIMNMTNEEIEENLKEKNKNYLTAADMIQMEKALKEQKIKIEQIKFDEIIFRAYATMIMHKFDADYFTALDIVRMRIPELIYTFNDIERNMNASVLYTYLNYVGMKPDELKELKNYIDEYDIYKEFKFSVTDKVLSKISSYANMIGLFNEIAYRKINVWANSIINHLKSYLNEYLKYEHVKANAKTNVIVEQGLIVLRTKYNDLGMIMKEYIDVDAKTYEELVPKHNDI